MKCFTCGAEIFDGVKICPRCGTAQPKYENTSNVGEETVYQQYPQPHNQSYNPVEPTVQYTLSVEQYQKSIAQSAPDQLQKNSAKRKKTVPLFIGVIAIVMIVSMIAAYFIYPWGDLGFGYIESNRYVNNSVGLVIEGKDGFEIKQPTDGDYTSDQILSSIEYDSKNKRYYYTEKNVNQREYFEAYVSAGDGELPAGIEVFYFDGNINARACSLDSKTIADMVKSGKAVFDDSSINVKCEKNYIKTIGKFDYDCYDYSGNTEINGVNVGCDISVAVYIAGNDAIVIMLTAFSVNGEGIPVDSLYEMIK